jgi:predicted permease
MATCGVKEPDRLADLSRTKRGRFGVLEISYPDFLEIRRRATTLDDVFLYEPMTRRMSMAGSDGPETVFGITVSLNYFASLGVTPASGQLFPFRGDEESRNNPFVVLSYAFWQRHFRGDPGIIGKTVQINGGYLRVTGVAAEGFQGVSIVSPDIWLPIGSTPMDAMRFTRRDLGWAMIGGRLKSGVSITAAAAEVNAIGVALARDYPTENVDSSLRLTAQSMIPGNLVVPVMGVFAMLLAFVSLVLIIACANLAGVLLSRAAARRRELAVRLAIGAGRARLVRQLLTEALIVFLLGAAAGLVVSEGLTAAVVAHIPRTQVPFNLSMKLDARVVAFTLGLSLLSAILCGLAPALQSSKADLISDLKNEGQTATRRGRLQNAFVVAQVALSVILVVGAFLFWSALQRVRSLDLGYDPHDIELVTINLRPGGQANVGSAYIRELAERVRALPGVHESSMAGLAPLEAGRITLDLRRPEEGSHVPRLPDSSVRVSWNSVDPGYFKTMRIPLLAGRDFSPSDTPDSQQVAIVSEKAAREFWPGENAVGKYLPARLGDPGANALVIGIVREIKPISGPQISPPTVYRPLLQRSFPFVTIVVRHAAQSRLSGQVRAILLSLNPNVPILNSQTLEEGIADATSPQRNAAFVTGSLGIVGLVLASIGVYGVTAYAVTRRTREIGIRMALGAERPQVITLVLREGMSLVGAGSAIGLLLAYIASRLAAASPLDVPPNDFRSFAGAAALLGVVGFIACWTPVRRATRIDAASALRHD